MNSTRRWNPIRPVPLPFLHNWPSRRLTCSVQTSTMALLLTLAPLNAVGSEASPGQVPTWLRAGAPLRLTLLSNAYHKPVVGEFRETRGESIWVRARYTKKEMAIPLAEIGRFEVSQERYPRTWTGAAYGLLAGAVMGVVVGANEGKEQGDTGARIFVDGIVLGGLGMAIGALVGHTIEVDRWSLIWSRSQGFHPWPPFDEDLRVSAVMPGAPEQAGAP